MSHKEVAAVCHGTGWSTTSSRSVHVRVEVDNGDWAVDFIERSKNRKNDGMVASERNNLWVDQSVLCDERRFRREYSRAVF